MENLKYSHEDKKWAEDLVQKLAQEFPEANIYLDEEHFIYEVVKPSGERTEVHVPRWETLPFKNVDGSVSQIRTEDQIRSDLGK